jgi:hypothetical protein
MKYLSTVCIVHFYFVLEYYSERNRRSSGSGKTNERRHSQSQQHKTPPRKVSNNDDVFIVPDTPTSNEDGIDQTNNDQGGQTMVRQQSRNWADCPIDESAAEPSPPPSANNTFSGDDFQVRSIFEIRKKQREEKFFIGCSE